MKRFIAWHPVLFAIFPALSMFSASAWYAPLSEVTAGTWPFLLGGAAILAASLLVFRNQHKAALWCSAFLLLFFTFRDVIAFLQDWSVGGVEIGRYRYLLGAEVVLLAVLAVLLRRLHGSLRPVTIVLNVVALGALSIPVWQLTKQNVSRLLAPPLPPLEIPQATRRPEPLPDVYYVIFDRYASRDTLARVYGLDNQPFYDFLLSRGFFVADASRANYPNTGISLASSLNMAYLDDLERTFGRDRQDWQPFFDRIGENRLATFLRQQGYTYIHLGSWWWPTRVGREAARNIAPWRLPASFYDLLQQTMLAPFAETFLFPVLGFNYLHWQQIDIGFQELHKLASQPGPKFVFAHFLVPHWPYVLRADGTPVDPAETMHHSREENYRTQVLGLNRLIERWVNHVLVESATPPVIVLQSDEGPYPAAYRWTGSKRDWRHATIPELREKSGILYAVYLPDQAYQSFYQQITPVNTFRIILDQYFGTSLGLLPDRVFMFETEIRPLAFIEITQRVWDSPPTHNSIPALGHAIQNSVARNPNLR
ncbi:MAG: hypothetical protein K6U09_06360 [Acidobacteriia bacterium]|jgi:hypothetical protein|nr:hypothetical protein [Terriglobia bacterium]